MSTQPESLRLADALEVDKWHITGVTAQESANELRRLHEVNQELLEACEAAEQIYAHLKLWPLLDKLRETIAKATGEQA